MNSHPTHQPKEGDVATFMHLHLSTATKKGKHPHREGHWVVEVEGKARPMLIIRALPNKDRGRWWFLAMPITSKGKDESGRTRRNVESIGNCLETTRESFVELEVRKYPENLLHFEQGGSPLITPCDQDAFRNFFRIVSHKALRGQLPTIG